MRDFLRRGGWVFLALLFVGTALVGGIYALVSNSSSGNSSGYISCPHKTITSKQQKVNGKVAGAKLAGFTPVKSVGYLQCWDLKAGSGATATATSTVTVLYTGALADSGIVFQSTQDSGNQPVSLSLNGGVIAGWTAGIPGMKVGGERRLLIPAPYAYGSSGTQGIPPNSNLVFDVTLLAVK